MPRPVKDVSKMKAHDLQCRCGGQDAHYMKARVYLAFAGYFHRELLLSCLLTSTKWTSFWQWICVLDQNYSNPCLLVATTTSKRVALRPEIKLLPERGSLFVGCVSISLF